jgi:hypothetical protein
MTFKQKKALTKVVENGGNVSKAMRDSGYSPNTFKTPSKLTNSKAWKEVLDEKLPDGFLLDALYIDIYNNPGDRKSLLELAFKIKGLLSERVLRHFDASEDGRIIWKNETLKPDFEAVINLYKDKYSD